MHLIMGAVYLCTGPSKKIPTSAHHHDDELPATIFTTGATAGARLSPPRRHLWNSLKLHTRDIDHRVQQLENVYGLEDHGKLRQRKRRP